MTRWRGCEIEKSDVRNETIKSPKFHAERETRERERDASLLLDFSRRGDRPRAPDDRTFRNLPARLNWKYKLQIRDAGPSRYFARLVRGKGRKGGGRDDRPGSSRNGRLHEKSVSYAPSVMPLPIKFCSGMLPAPFALLVDPDIPKEPPLASYLPAAFISRARAQTCGLTTRALCTGAAFERGRNARHEAFAVSGNISTVETAKGITVRQLFRGLFKREAETFGLNSAVATSVWIHFSRLE